MPVSWEAGRLEIGGALKLGGYKTGRLGGQDLGSWNAGKLGSSEAMKLEGLVAGSQEANYTEFLWK